MFEVAPLTLVDGNLSHESIGLLSKLAFLGCLCSPTSKRLARRVHGEVTFATTLSTHRH